MHSDENVQGLTYPVTVSREYPPAPLVAVAAVVIDDAGLALMVVRGRPPSKGLWALPGGLLDLGEPCVRALPVRCRRRRARRSRLSAWLTCLSRFTGTVPAAFAITMW